MAKDSLASKLSKQVAKSLNNKLTTRLASQGKTQDTQGQLQDNT